MALDLDEPLILDGGLATELAARGCDISGALWSARVLRERPDAVENLHYDYYAAGANVAITASYQASYEGFAAAGIDADETTRLLELSVELARNARARFRSDRAGNRRELLVAASVGPYGAISHDGAEYRGDYGLTVDALVAFHARRFEVLASARADLLACETIPTLDEARAFVSLLERRPDARAWLSFTSPDGRHTSHGEPLADCARLADGAQGVIAVGVNCVRPEVVGNAIRTLRAATNKPIVVYPNSGERWDAADESWHGAPANVGLAQLAGEWVRAGAKLVGGCCRVGPAHIAALATTLRKPVIEAAVDADLPAIRSLLEHNELPASDIADGQVVFLVAREGPLVVGAGGLEVHGKAGLLRSIVVADSRRGAGVGRAIVESVEAAARQRGVKELVLLTETVPNFFAGLGYTEIPRERAPVAVRDSAEFRSLCPQSARCMSKRISG